MSSPGGWSSTRATPTPPPVLAWSTHVDAAPWGADAAYVGIDDPTFSDGADVLVVLTGTGDAAYAAVAAGVCADDVPPGRVTVTAGRHTAEVDCADPAAALSRWRATR